MGNLDLARDLVHLLDSREALDVHVHEQLDLLRQVVHPPPLQLFLQVVPLVDDGLCRAVKFST